MRQSLLQWAIIALFGCSLAAMLVELSLVGAIQALAFDFPDPPVVTGHRGPYPAVPVDLAELGLPGAW